MIEAHQNTNCPGAIFADLSSDGRKVAASYADTTVIYDIDGQDGQKYIGHVLADTNETNLYVYLSPDENKLAVISHRIRIYDLTTYDLLWYRALNIRQVSFSPDGSKLAILCFFREISVVDSQTGEELARLNYDTDQVAVRFSRDGTSVISIDYYGVVHVRELVTGNRRTLWPNRRGTQKRTDYGHFLALSHDGKMVVVQNKQLDLAVMDIQTKKIRHIVLTPHRATTACFSPNDALIAMGTVTGRVQIYSPATGERLADIKLENSVLNGIRLLRFSQDGHRLLVVPEYGGATLWELNW